MRSWESVRRCCAGRRQGFRGSYGASKRAADRDKVKLRLMSPGTGCLPEVAAAPGSPVNVARCRMPAGSRHVLGSSPITTTLNPTAFNQARAWARKWHGRGCVDRPREALGRPRAAARRESVGGGPPHRAEGWCRRRLAQGALDAQRAARRGRALSVDHTRAHVVNSAHRAWPGPITDLAQGEDQGGRC
jgi:hypothetical protein